nr:GGDEF domain-containing protein [uncultured Desulfuromonas sp.]
MAEKFFKFSQDTLWLILALVIVLFITIRYDVVETISFLVRDHHELHLNEILIALLCSLVFAFIFVVKRLKELGSCRCKLLDSLREINALSTTDRLTGLNNRRYFVKIASRDVVISLHAGGTPLIAMIDLDHMTTINDAFGQQIGDQVLKQVAELISSSLGETDLAARYRGATFIIFIGDGHLSEVKKRFDRLREKVFDNVFFSGVEQVSTSISIGIASKQPTTASLGDLINDAEIALYEAKDSGRNRVICR